VSELKVNKVTPSTGTQVELEATTVLVDGTLRAPTVNNPTGVAVQHNGSTKIATTSTGVTVTGTVAATAFSGDGSALTGVVATGIGGSSSTGSLTLQSDSDNSGSGDIVFQTAATERGRISLSTGNVAFDTDVLFVDAAANRVGINDSTPSYELDVNGTVAATSAVVSGNLAVDTDTLFVDSSNNRVGIGTSTPTTALDVAGTVNATGFTGTLGSLASALLPTGCVLQVAVGTYATQFDFSSSTAGTFQTTGLEVNITPKRSNSMIILLFNANSYAIASGAASGISARLSRQIGTATATAVAGSTRSYWPYVVAGGIHLSPETLLCTDSPSTTSQVKYTLQVTRLTSSATTAGLFWNNNTAYALAIEVAV